jgi:hypothetical protein
MDDSLQRILFLADEIESLFIHSAPAPNPTVLSRVRFLCDRLAGVDNGIAQEAVQIASLSGLYFSARAHCRRRGGGDEIRTRITMDHLRTIRRRARACDEAASPA